MANSRRKRLEREIDRDARVTTSGFVHEIVAATLGQLQRVSLASACPDPVDMFDAVDAITRKFRNLHRRLNDARINRRGDRDRDAPPPAQLPPALRPFAYHGRYLGAFPSVEAFAHACIDPLRPETWAAHVDLTQVGIDLHLSGRYWTVDDEGVTHAFALAQTEDGPPVDGSVDGSVQVRVHGSVDGKARPGSRQEPPPPRHESTRARALLRAAGLDEGELAVRMEHYVARYVSLADHAWHHLRAAGMPAWLLGHADLAAMVEDWCVSGVLTTLPDPEGGVHVFAHRDPLASDE
jgi:hypothetical protein